MDTAETINNNFPFSIGDKVIINPDWNPKNGFEQRHKLTMKSGSVGKVVDIAKRDPRQKSRYWTNGLYTITVSWIQGRGHYIKKIEGYTEHDLILCPKKTRKKKANPVDVV